MQEGTFKNIVSSVRQWVNDKIERISYVVALNINSLNLRLTNVESGKQNILTAGDGVSIDSANTISVVGKQNSTDNSLTTTSKTIVGAINELKSTIDAINARLHELRSYSSAFDNSFI